MLQYIQFRLPALLNNSLASYDNNCVCHECIYVTERCGNPKIFGRALCASGQTPLSKFLNPPLWYIVFVISLWNGMSFMAPSGKIITDLLVYCLAIHCHIPLSPLLILTLVQITYATEKYVCTYDYETASNRNPNIISSCIPFHLCILSYTCKEHVSPGPIGKSVIQHLAHKDASEIHIGLI